MLPQIHSRDKLGVALTRTWLQTQTTLRRVDVYDAGWIDVYDLRVVATGQGLLGAVGVLVAVKDIAWAETVYDRQEHSKTKVGVIGPIMDTIRRSVGDQHIKKTTVT